ncbi:MAG: L-aspartate oxidase [Chloroflexota bacterium]
MIIDMQTDALIIGCGIAGGSVALQLADSGRQVTVITRAKEAKESNTYYAQGGIIYRGEQDTPDLLAEDVMRAGAGHCDERAVNMLAEQGPPLVKEVLLERIGVPFDRTKTGALSLAREGGHTLARIIHATDATGKAIASTMLDVLETHPNITLLTSYTALDLIMSDPQSAYHPPRCLGAYLLERESGQVMRCVAQSTVLATGGLGQVFQRTTNPLGARGDGVAMASRVGARIINMEYVQFHPTTFAHPEARSFLISEAVRGAGARLVHANGEPFMQHYDAEWLDLAPRDVVARSIQAEMEKHQLDHVYLDLRSYIDQEEIYAHFPTIYQTCLSYGVDISQDLVPVAPAAHYACGGIWVDGWGQTSLMGLYAIGEASCTGLHGANRLASTSLLEGLVWGDRAAQHIEMCADSYPLPTMAQLPTTNKYDANTRLEPQQKLHLTNIATDIAQVQDIMWHHVGLVRTTAGLEEAGRSLVQLQADIDARYQHLPLTDQISGLQNLVQVALLITTAALRNQVSAGCHYRVN